MTRTCTLLSLMLAVYLLAHRLGGGDLLRYAAVAAGCVLPYAISRADRTVPKGQITFQPAPMRPYLYLLPLFVCVIFGLSALTALLVRPAPVSGSFWKLLFTSALLPALGEEFFFRYLLLRMLEPYSQTGAVLLSSLFFALVHTPAAMPYAFVAGLLLATLTLASGTVLTAMLFHFCNNTASLLLSAARDLAVFPYLVGGLCLLGCVSLLWAVGSRQRPGRKKLRQVWRRDPRTGAALRAAAASPLSLVAVWLLTDAIW
ncbi:MAG: CPBP family intramembrane glutamic endopeptidase [Eubacteriales bacterium]